MKDMYIITSSYFVGFLMTFSTQIPRSMMT